MRRRVAPSSLSSSLVTLCFGSGPGAVPPRPPATAALGEKGVKAAGGGSLTGGAWDPANSLTKRGRECPVGAFRYLISQKHMTNQERQKVDRGKELVIGAEPRMDLGSLIMDETVG